MNKDDVFEGVLGADDIVKLMPYRYPMVMIDRVLKLEKDKFAHSIKNVSFNESFFQGHFPGHAIMPGVMILEAIAQTSVILWTYFHQNEKENKVVYFSSLDKVKFRKPVVPGDVLDIYVYFERRVGKIWKFRGEAFVGDDKVAQSVFAAALMDLGAEDKGNG